jgi:hypothetical protein
MMSASFRDLLCEQALKVAMNLVHQRAEEEKRDFHDGIDVLWVADSFEEKSGIRDSLYSLYPHTGLHLTGLGCPWQRPARESGVVLPLVRRTSSQDLASDYLRAWYALHARFFGGAAGHSARFQIPQRACTS